LDGERQERPRGGGRAQKQERASGKLKKNGRKVIGEIAHTDGGGGEKNFRIDSKTNKSGKKKYTSLRAESTWEIGRRGGKLEEGSKRGRQKTTAERTAKCGSGEKER